MMVGCVHVERRGAREGGRVCVREWVDDGGVCPRGEERG